MIEMWSWIIPLLKTGFVFACFAFWGIYSLVKNDSDSEILYCISFSLFTPLAVAGLSFFAWCVYGILYGIWK